MTARIIIGCWRDDMTMMMRSKKSQESIGFYAEVTSANSAYKFITLGADGVEFTATLPNSSTVIATGDTPIFDLSANTGTAIITADVGLTAVDFHSTDQNKIIAFNSDLSLVTNLDHSFYKASLISFDVNLPLVTNANYAWAYSKLTSFSSDMPEVIDISYTWRNCPIASFNIDLSSATNVVGAWYRSGIASFDTDLPAALNVTRAWLENTSLISFASNLTKVTNAYFAWNGCTSLTNFAPTNFGVLTNATGAWAGCNLNQQSVENVLKALDECGATGKTTTIGKDSSPLTAAAQIHYDNLTISKGWTIL